VFRLPTSARPASHRGVGAAAVRGARRDAAVPRARRTAAFGAVVAVVAVAAAACGGGATAQDTAVGNGSSFVAGSYGTTVYQPGARPAAPRVTGTTLSGTRFELSADRGAVVVLNFWGSWCTPCRAEAPALGALARHLSGTGVRFVGVDIRDDPASAEAFMRTFRISYPSLNDPGDAIALDFSGTVPPAGIPTTLVIDQSGRIAARIVGTASYDGLRTLIAHVSAEHS
jgi:thiol-disulfide isomerase/thioredoxin